MRDSELGLEVFLTGDIPGMGGKLKRAPEDFIVDEISVLPTAAEDGKYVIARVWHRNWEANRLVRRLGSNLHVSRSRIGFAGTKDGRSVSTQLMSFDAPIEQVRALTIPDVKIMEAYTARRMISIGDLIGNRFEIKVAEIDPATDAKGTCDQVTARLNEAGGFPNFFGVQRFGTIRPITHLIGKDLVNGDVEGAVMHYIANPLGDGSDVDVARKNLQETRDFERAFREYPMKLTFERMMIDQLRGHPEDFIGALRRLPSNLLMMFVHAYQSYLFNQTLSERMRRGLPIGVPQVGDLVLPLDKLGLPDHDNPIEVTEDNVDKAKRNAKEGKAFVSGLIFGSQSQFAGGQMGEIERAIVEREGIAGPDFEIVGLREASSKGTRRELLAPFKGLLVTVDGTDVMFRFSLNKGCYATSMLREYMKADIGQY
jgi:tRNA pseudouridine13 synthase